jgi:sortase A
MHNEVKQSRRPWRAALKWTERALFVGGLILLGIYGTARIESVLRSHEALRQFEQLDSQPAEIAVGNTEAGESTAHPDPADADFSLRSGQRIDAYRETFAERTGAPLAVLRIAKVGLVVPVLDGTDDLTLNHAVGRIPGTAWPGQRGNVGIAGHRDSFFRKLKDVNEGDAIELQTLRGTDTYIADQISVVTPDHVEVLRPRDVPSLTLVTCYPFYYVGSAPQRYIVTAFLSQERKNGTENRNTPAVISQTLKGERQ